MSGVEVERLAGRTATCGCGKSRPSIEAQEHEAFFEYRGPGYSRPQCQCGYSMEIHQPINPFTGRAGITDHPAVLKNYATDSFYCGCRGWD